MALGMEAARALEHSRIAIFGLGGVGGWCAEALARTGAGRLALVDFDRVAPSNVNRQTAAVSKTIGMPKTEALASRLRDINPGIVLDLRNERYCAETAASFDLAAFDCVIDAIDTLDSKALLVRNALASPSTALFSSMGAALKTDSFQIRKSVFRKVEGDGLARALRRRFRETGGIPERDFECVWSPERRENAFDAPQGDTTPGKRTNGSLVHITAAFGFALAGLAIAEISRRAAPGI